MVKIKAKQGRTFRARFTIRKFRELRDLTSDILSFGVFHSETGAAVTGVDATTGAGITQNESGDAILTLNAALMGFAEGTNYVHELTITEGSSGETYTLLTGPFVLENTYLS